MRVRLSAEVSSQVEPELIREALLDFSDRRPEIWPQLDPSIYEVHWIGGQAAEVTEGSRFPFVWSRERYDWSAPPTITWTAVESNFCASDSYVSMRIERSESGGSSLNVEWDRVASGPRGWAYLLIARLGGRRLLTWATRTAVSDVASAFEVR